MNTLTFQLHDKDTAHVLFQGKSLFACLVFVVCCFSWVFLTTAFPRQLAYLLSGSAEHWRIHWKTENLLCFSTYISAAQLNASSELTAKAACLTEPGSGQLCWRRYQQEDPILQTSHTHAAQLSLSWYCWLAQGGGSKRVPFQRSGWDLFLPVWSRKDSKTQQGVTATRNLSVMLCKTSHPCEAVSSDL